MAWHGSAALPSSPCPERPRRLAPLRRFPPVSTAAVRCALRTPLAGLAIQRCDALLVTSGLRMAGLIAALLTELLTGFYELPVPHAQVGQLLAAKGQLYKGVEYMLRAFELEPIGQVGLRPPSIAATSSLGAACAANGRHSLLCAIVTLSLLAALEYSLSIDRALPSLKNRAHASLPSLRADGPRHRQRVHPRQPGEESRALVGSPWSLLPPASPVPW